MMTTLRSDLSHYMRDVSRIEVLPYSRQLELIRAAQGGCVDSRNRVVECNLKLVVHITKKASKQVPMDDLVQEGNRGLFRAVDLFDESREVRFSTYATYWIRQFISNAVKQRRVVHVPFMHFHYLSMERQGDPVQLTGTVARALEKARVLVEDEVVSLGTLDEWDRTLETKLADPHAGDPADMVAQLELTSAMLEAVARLPERHRRVIEMRFGLGCRPMTLEAIAVVVKPEDARGRRYRIGKERVRQIQEEALVMLREVLRAEPDS